MLSLRRLPSLSTGFELLLILLACFTNCNARSLDLLLLNRRLDEGGADEDDEIGDYDDDDLDDDADWWKLERYIERDSLLYDTIEAFLYIADLFFIVWLAWGCLVHIGVLPDSRLDRRRDLRRVYDGRGVFSPVRNYDPFESDDDNASVESMEYGKNHLDDEYGGIDADEEERRLNKSAEEYFSRPDRQSRRQQNARSTADREHLLDLELTTQKHPGAQTIFI